MGRRIVTTVLVRRSGNSLCLNLTRELGLLGLDRGDLVRVTLERVDGESERDG